MKADLLKFLACPSCKKGLELEAGKSSKGEIMEGTLSCTTCGNSYEIENGIPILLPPSLCKEKKAEIDYPKKIPDKEYNWIHTKPFKDNVDTTRGHIYDITHMLSCIPYTKDDIILDAGAGSAWTSIWLARCGMKVVAADISPGMLDVGQLRTGEESGLDLSFAASDIETLAFGENLFTRVFCYDALHHVQDPQKAVSEFHRVLAPGGWLTISEPNAGHAKNPDSIEWAEKYGTTERGYSPGEHRKMFEDSGFSDVTVKPGMNSVLNPAVRDGFGEKRGLARLKWMILSAKVFGVPLFEFYYHSPLGLLKSLKQGRVVVYGRK